MPPIFSNTLEGLYGIGFGFKADSPADNALGYSDGSFWIYGECPFFHVSSIPASATKVDSLWFPGKGAWGYFYYKTADGRGYLAQNNGSGPFWRVLTFDELKQLVNSWRNANAAFTLGPAYKADLYKCGFLYLGLDYWKAQFGFGKVPDDLMIAISDPINSLNTILSYLPKTAKPDTGTGIPMGSNEPGVSWPPRFGMQNAQQFDPLLLLLAMQNLNANKTKKKSKRRR